MMITKLDQLEAIYGRPHERAVRKEIPFLNEDYRAFVETSPFIILSSAGPEGMDCSPKGDAPGFVRILNDRTLAIPDRPGNNRIDNLRNVVVGSRVGLLFFVPGVGETLRVNGAAEISVDADMLNSFAVDGKRPRTVIIVHVEAAYFHCSKAIMRSDLWNHEKHVERSRLPSPGDMHKRLSGGEFDGDAYDRQLPERTKASLY